MAYLSFVWLFTIISWQADFHRAQRIARHLACTYRNLKVDNVEMRYNRLISRVNHISANLRCHKTYIAIKRDVGIASNASSRDLTL